MAKRKTFTVQGKEISLITKAEAFISLTDIDRAFDGGGSHIESWLRNRNTVEFLGVWERVHNADFNSVEFDGIFAQTGLNRFKLSVKRWVNATKAVGIEARAGRYGGTYAHPDIAFNFCFWISPTFQVYAAKEFQRLKQEEAQRLYHDQQWNLRRELAKINWHRHQQAVKLLPPRKLDLMGERFIYANESDLLNLALFGLTAKKWQQQNPNKKGNMRDHASIEQLTVLANLENINALLIENGLTQDERLQILNEEAIKQMDSLLQYDRAQRLKSMEEEE